jgi:hypothetical protein
MKRLIAFISLIALFLAGCGAAATPAAPAQPALQAQKRAATAAPAAEALDNYAGAPAPAPGAAGNTGANAPSGAPLPQPDRKIIKNAAITLEVQDVFSALNQVTLLSSQYGGHVLESRSWYVQDYPHATYTFAVPVERFEEAIEQVRRLGKVLDEKTSGQDVTDQYVDLEARIRNQEATAERIRGFLDQTRTVDEALKVNQQLAQVEELLEQLKGQRNALGQRAAFSTISVVFSPAIPNAGAKLSGVWSPLGTLAQATDALAAILQVLVDITIWVVVLSLPFIVIGGVIFLVGRLGWRLLARRKRA